MKFYQKKTPKKTFRKQSNLIFLLYPFSLYYSVKLLRRLQQVHAGAFTYPLNNEPDHVEQHDIELQLAKMALQSLSS